MMQISIDFTPSSSFSIKVVTEANWVFSGNYTCEPNGATTKTTSGPHHLPSLVPADMVSLVGDIGRSLHALKKEQTQVDSGFNRKHAPFEHMQSHDPKTTCQQHNGKDEK